jgi:hypothetical protein
MTESSEKRMCIDQPMSIWLRVLLIVAGFFVAFLTTRALWGAVFPVTVISFFFGIILIGSWFISAFFIFAGFFGNAIKWLIWPGNIEVTIRSPFGRRQYCYQSNDIAELFVREQKWTDGPSDWNIILSTHNNKEYSIGRFDTPDKAEGKLRQIKSLIF